MAKRPPVSEVEFLRLSSNHGEFSRKLATLAVPGADVLEYAKHVCECWFRLAEEHLAEADRALAATCNRAVFSRSYYAAYNASKATRYLVRGAVSMKGDDHGAASGDLPDDLPNVEDWSQRIIRLYEHRLRADYDNWPTTAKSHTMAPAETITTARDFLQEVRMYLNAKFGMTL
jgi:hypothetical protein